MAMLNNRMVYLTIFDTDLLKKTCLELSAAWEYSVSSNE